MKLSFLAEVALVRAHTHTEIGLIDNIEKREGDDVIVRSTIAAGAQDIRTEHQCLLLTW